MRGVEDEGAVSGGISGDGGGGAGGAGGAGGGGAGGPGIPVFSSIGGSAKQKIN